MLTKKEVIHLARHASLTTRKCHLQLIQSFIITGSPQPSWPRDPSVPQPLPVVNISCVLGLGSSQNVTSIVHMACPRLFLSSTWCQVLGRLVTIRDADWQTSHKGKSIGTQGIYIFQVHAALRGTRVPTRLPPESRGCKHNKQHAAYSILCLPHIYHLDFQDYKALPRSIPTEPADRRTFASIRSPLSRHIGRTWLFRNLCRSFRGIPGSMIQNPSLSMSSFPPTGMAWQYFQKVPRFCGPPSSQPRKLTIYRAYFSAS